MTSKRTRELAPGTTGAPDSDAWVLVTVTLTAGLGSLRVHVWRKLRSLGAVYLQSSVCLLPDRPEVRREVRLLLDRVHRDGGTAQSLHISLTDPSELEWLHAEFNAARDAEYAEVIERLPTFTSEITTERAKGRATYAEVEESEADLDRFRSWLAKIEKRDYFGAALGEQARIGVAAAAEQLAAFEAEALEAEAPTGVTRRLRGLPGRQADRDLGSR